VGVQCSVTVWEPGKGPLPPVPRKKVGRPPRLLRRDRDHQPITVKQLALSLPSESWKTVTWGQGTRYKLRSRFAALRVGYRRIQGALSNLGHELARTTVTEILERHGIEPAPDRKRKTTWTEFLTQHWDAIVAADFFAVEVWTPKGLQRFVVLFFIELSSRRIEIGGIAPNPNGLWMGQVARNVTDASNGILAGKRYLFHDRDPLFTAEFLNVLANAGVNSVKLPARSLNLNAYAERFVRSIKESCLERMIFFGEDSLRTAIHNCVAHYHTERNHQGLSNKIICPQAHHFGRDGDVQRHERLGSMLNYYYREAA
jgi:putative transposase